jgi:hypothetical protein
MEESLEAAHGCPRLRTTARLRTIAALSADGVVAQSESPLRRAFWLGEVDARVPALFRIGLGLVVLSDIVDRLRDLFGFYTDLGLVAARSPLQRWLRPSLFDAFGSPAGVSVLFTFGLLAAAAFLVGYRSRLATALLWLFMLSLSNRNPHIADGGDTVIRMLLFWTLFLDVGAALSLDVRLGRRPRQASVPAAPLRLVQLQVAVIYLFTFLAKTGPSWRDGSAVLRAVASAEWGRGLAPLLAAHPGLCRALTWATLALEGSFAFLVLSPWRPSVTRAVALGAGTALHLGILLTMRVGVFSEVMPVSYLALVPAAWVERLAGPAVGIRASPARPALVAALALQMALVITEQALRPAGHALPSPVGTELTLLGLHQNWSMFAPDSPLLEVRWQVPGRLADGSTVDVARAVAPGLVRRGGFFYSRWHKLRNTLASQDPALVAALGRYLCRRYRGARAGRLERFDLVGEIHDLDPRGPQPPAEQAVFVRQRCSGPEAQDLPPVPHGPDRAGGPVDGLQRSDGGGLHR